MANSDNKNTFHVIGLMSGTSLDGLDIAYCEFMIKGTQINYQIICAETVDYSELQKKMFVDMEYTDAVHFLEADRQAGNYFGLMVLNFIEKYKIDNVDFISSHGHTIFHQPAKGFTVQVGNGANLAAICSIPVVCDFRSLDVALKGQGAPLVPIGDKFLFSAYNFCLNLGGIANITDQSEMVIKAFDICPANMVLNYLSRQKGLEFDQGGIMASVGNANSQLLEELNGLRYYQMNPPKSLGKEWIISDFIPVIEKSNISLEDKLATVTEHIALQVSKSILNTAKSGSKLLVTGGGAFNTFLIKRMEEKLGKTCELIIPDEKTVKFKEALIFALLGLLRWTQQVNCLKSVTGSSKDNIGGCIYIN